MHDDRSRARAAADDVLGTRLEPAHRQVVRKHPHTIAAHLGDGPVGVAIVHEPVVGTDAGREVVEHSCRLQRAGAGDPQDPVRADATAPVTQGGDRCGAQVVVDVQVGQHDEVVLRAVSLGELHGFQVTESRRCTR